MTYFLEILDENKIITGFNPDKCQVDKDKDFTRSSFKGFGYSKCCLKTTNYTQGKITKTYTYLDITVKEYSLVCKNCNHDIIGNLHESNKPFNFYDWKTFLINNDWSKWNIKHEN